MGTLKELMAEEIDTVFMDTTEFAEDLNYLQGVGPAFTVRGIPEEVQFQTTNEEGFGIVVTRWVFAIPVADFHGKRPRAGDYISRTVNGVLQRFKVAPDGASGTASSVEVTGLLYSIETNQEG
jgi:hypothetical protein